MGSAIVAGIESGWVNPVINREYALEEVQQVRILIELLPRFLQSCYRDLLVPLLPLHFCGLWPCSQ